MNHDAAWYLHMVGVWLDGGRLYRDVIDTNPPLIVFLTAIPVWIARVLHVSEPPVFKACVFVAAAIAIAASSRPLRKITASGASLWLLTITLVFAVLPFVRSDFGQREHIAVVMVLPFVLSAAGWSAARPPGRFDAVAGIVAGLGFAIKPHFLLAFAAIELSLLLAHPRSGSWRRPAAIAAAATLILYALVVVLATPDYFTVAREVMQVYGALNASSASLLRLRDPQNWIVAAIALAVVRVDGGYRTPLLVLFACASGFLAAALFQLKGWAYHLYPFRVFFLLFFGLLVSAVMDSHPAALAIVRGGRRSLNAAVLAALTLWSVRYAGEAWRPATPDLVKSFTDLVHAEHADSLAVLSMRTIVYPAFPTVNYTHARWPLRHHSLWFLPGLYPELERDSGDLPFHRVEAMGPLERRLFEEIVDDLCAHPPQIIVVEPPIPRAPAGRRSLDLVGYYRQDERFERMFRAYEPVATMGPFLAHARRSAAACESH